MFRFEVHLRITDNASEQIPHMTNAACDPADGFLLSTLFNSNKNVVVAGSVPLSTFNSDAFDLSSHSKSVLSSLVSDDLCSSLVDDLMYHAGECLTDAEDSNIWKPRFEFNSQSESECRFAECVASLVTSGIHMQDEPPHSKVSESDSDLSWGSFDGSYVDRLWTNCPTSTDPHHPLQSTASVSTKVSDQQRHQYTSSWSTSPSSSSSEQDNTGLINSEDEDVLWKSLSRDDDPYHPLNFRAPFKSLRTCMNEPTQHSQTSTEPNAIKTRCRKPKLMQKQIVRHQCPQICVEKPTKVPWKRPSAKTPSTTKKIPIIKKVKFSPFVQVHNMQTWAFALQACRKGPWEEHARDRNRFQRRIFETEQAIGYCFSLSHRVKYLKHINQDLTEHSPE